MRNKKLSTIKFLFVLAAAIISISSCSLTKGEDGPTQHPILGPWQLVGVNYEVSIDDQDIVSYLMENREINQDEAEVIRTDFLNSNSRELIRRMMFSTGENTIGLKKGDSESVVSGTYILTDDNKNCTITETNNGMVWAFEILELRRNEKMVLLLPEEIMFDITGNGVNEKINLKYKMDYEKIRVF